MFKLCFFVPESHLESTKRAIFDAGAGKIGDYDSCAWQCAGQGQFRPLEGSQPFLGEQGEVEYVDEFKVEIVCADDRIKDALAALRRAHPYEEPAFEVFRMESLD
ncbi:MAG: NGG1p interacting factor NIF3 [Alteromonadaceae bacterium]|nr:NGG1p interacting factor NIF3 [Alteromonadaceae bacterium]MBH84155.1 NGG1p interacting factor NIF3 [Alteromonadaceae bacterium]|tara:strand:+ start:337 stop:651 length:315 start_codon:yes stop_codon:yes gene_type:complete